jgi:hypothetical protein
MLSSRFALTAFLAVLFLGACGGSQPTGGAPSAPVQPAARSLTRSLNGYYLAKFTTVVGTSPSASLCFRFLPSGRWYSTGTLAEYYGTYLIAGKVLYASAVWPASAALYLTLQGPVNAKKGSGEFIVANDGGDVYGGGTYTMVGKQNSTCG